ncbi:MAG: SH3 domain-containing protein [Cytophagaceae bacterium]|nr:SH3 domain-containing protein [Cytophagaceae bacterium]
MSLQDKYKELLETAKTSEVNHLQVREQDNVLYVDGDAPSGEVKDKLWNVYNKIDPDYRAGDLVMNVNVVSTAGQKAKVTTDQSNLNIRKGPGTDQPIVGKAAHNEMVTLLSKTNDQWYLIKTDAGEEGYAYAQYLTPQ